MIFLGKVENEIHLVLYFDPEFEDRHVHVRNCFFFFIACQPKRSNAQGLHECFRAMMRVIGEDSDWEKMLVIFRRNGASVTLILVA